VTSNRWLILAVLFLARAAMSFQFQTIGAVGPLLIDQLHIDFTWLGTLIGLYMLPGASRCRAACSASALARSRSCW
jgi:hypothetical protein